MIGCSDASRDKWGRLEYLLAMHVNACKGIVKRNSWASRVYEYFDFYAGPGVYTEDDRADLRGETGSPLRAINLLKGMLHPTGLMNFMRNELMTWRAWLYEPNRKTFARLVAATEHVACEPINRKRLTCEKAINEILDTKLWKSENEWNRGRTYGLAFFDPNGIPDWESIGKFGHTPHFQHVDLLINVCSVGIKRARRAFHGSTTATEHLRSLGKREIYLWDPVPGDTFQFALALCTNWRGFPHFATSRFYHIDSPEGRTIANRIDYTRDERGAA